jgi:hypothetical protein
VPLCDDAHESVCKRKEGKGLEEGERFAKEGLTRGPSCKDATPSLDRNLTTHGSTVLVLSQ